MRKVNVLLIALFLMAAGSALAACPDVLGIWSSNAETNPDYPMLNGRVSEAWCDGSPSTAGDIQNAMSWEGATLGTELYASLQVDLVFFVVVLIDQLSPYYVYRLPKYLK